MRKLKIGLGNDAQLIMRKKSSARVCFLFIFNNLKNFSYLLDIGLEIRDTAMRNTEIMITIFLNFSYFLVFRLPSPLSCYSKA